MKTWKKITASMSTPAPRRDPRRHDQLCVRPGVRAAPGESPRDRGQYEKTEQPENPVDHHRGDRLGLLDPHPDQVCRLDQIAADRPGNHQVEDIADEAQQYRSTRE